MGIDLRLFPIDALHDDTVAGKSPWGYSHTILGVPRNGEMFDVIANLRSKTLPDGHDISGHLGEVCRDGYHKDELVYGRFGDDPYGDPYTWVDAKALAEVLTRTLPSHPTTAYISALPSDTRVILGWH